MKKILGLLLKLSITLVIITSLGIIAITTFVDPNKFKPEIIDLVKKTTGRDLVLEGNLSWSFIPNVAISLKDVTLKNSSSFEGDLINIKQAKVAVNFVELLQKKFHVTGIYIDGLELTLINDENDNNNIADLIVIHTEENTTIQDHESKKIKISQIENKEDTLIHDLKITELKIKNSSITYKDKKNNTHYQLKKINIKAKNLSLTNNPKELENSEEYSTIEMTAKLKDLYKTNNPDLYIDLTANLHQKEKLLQISKLMLSINNLGVEIKTDIISKNNIITAKPATVSLANSVQNMTIVYDFSKTTKTFKLDNKSNVFEIETLLSAIGSKPLIKGQTEITVAANSNWRQLNKFIGHLKTKTELNINNGVIYGFNLRAILDQTESTLHKLFNSFKEDKGMNIISLIKNEVGELKQTTDKNNNYTKFNKIYFSAPSTQLKINNSTLLLAHDDYELNGHGSINLNTKEIDYYLKATLRKQLQQTTDKSVTDYMLRTPLPIRITGTIEDPIVKPLFNQYAQNALSELQKDLISDLTKKAIDNIGDKLTDSIDLKSIFGKK